MALSYAQRSDLAAQAFAVARLSHTGWWQSNCPFCPVLLGKIDKRRTWGMNSETGGWHCFRCGTSGKMPIDGEFIEEARRRAMPSIKPDAAVGPPDGFIPLASPDGSSALSLHAARTYLMSRGLGPDRWADLGLGACITGRYADRVIVPIYGDDWSTWLGWVGRTWFKRAQVPYLYPPGMRRGEILYNRRVLFIEDDDPVYVVEGVFDAISLWPSAVALLGKASEPQIEDLVRARRPIVVVLDGDAHEEGWALAMKLRFRGQRAGAVKLPPRVDPDEVPLAWLKESARKSLVGSGNHSKLV